MKLMDIGSSSTAFPAVTLLKALQKSQNIVLKIQEVEQRRHGGGREHQDEMN
jgi:hypothetical protein